MDVHTIDVIETVIEHIEAHLDQRLDLESVASNLHYSRYHLHRMFTDTVGMTIHDYVVRRRLTEAAMLLHFRNDPYWRSRWFADTKASSLLQMRLKLCTNPLPQSTGETENFIPCS